MALAQALNYRRRRHAINVEAHNSGREPRVARRMERHVVHRGEPVLQLAGQLPRALGDAGLADRLVELKLPAPAPIGARTA